MEHVGSLPLSQELVTAQYVKLNESSTKPYQFVCTYRHHTKFSLYDLKVSFCRVSNPNGR